MTILLAFLRRVQRRRRLDQFKQQAHGTAFADVFQHAQPLTHAAHETHVTCGCLRHIGGSIEQALQPRHMRIDRRIAILDGIDVALLHHHAAHEAVHARAKEILEHGPAVGLVAVGHGAAQRRHGGKQRGRLLRGAGVAQPRTPARLHATAAILLHRGHHTLIFQQFQREARGCAPEAKLMASLMILLATLRLIRQQRTQHAVGRQRQRGDLACLQTQVAFGIECQSKVRHQAITGRRALLLERQHQRNHRLDGALHAQARGLGGMLHVGDRRGEWMLRDLILDRLGYHRAGAECIHRFAPHMQLMTVPIGVQDKHGCGALGVGPSRGESS